MGQDILTIALLIIVSGPFGPMPTGHCPVKKKHGSEVPRWFSDMCVPEFLDENIYKKLIS